MMHDVILATSPEELNAILELRYTVLRKPWNQHLSSAGDDLDATAVQAVLLDTNHKAMACGRLQENEGRVGQIRYMAVREDVQGKGYGKKILRFLEDKASALKLLKIELHARENAVPFYLSCGYQLCEPSYKLWDIIQHYRMEKAIH